MSQPARDPWAILGLSPGSPDEMVRAQYLRLVRINHPDQYASNPTEQARREEIMKQVTWAYQEIVHGKTVKTAKTTATRSGTSRPTAARPRPVDLTQLQCRAHHRWAVVYCTVCGEPLCSRCDESLSGYCAKHRPRRRP
ncbi:MAG: molecular chaperone DnaJ [Sulfobacillus acidophilus]|uniref:Molecular chaperone DnaJ n=1 Tax=Sulfobacillus acidophilus TaxID=53633 RepID=A0A2T2WI65_9FIRM|nr:MAG: molecular chaperone DnaJ [Sulfobacillus acidophilus]